MFLQEREKWKRNLKFLALVMVPNYEATTSRLCHSLYKIVQGMKQRKWKLSARELWCTIVIYLLTS